MRYIHIRCAYLILFILLLGAGCLSCDDQSTTPSESPPGMTLDEVYAAPITTLVGQELVLRENVTWDTSPVGILGAVVPGQEPVPNGNPLTLNFETADRYIERKYHDEGNISIIFSDVTTVLNPNAAGGRDYYYQDMKLDRQSTYYLRGTFYYKEKVDQSWLDNPAFIEQSNNIVYWTQTFEFRLQELSDMPISVED